ncbi:MAG TPA: TonB-dependent receptor [Blastocatellia bacterium]|nr:TonB-dependent receptor [Blastocatellia bacterium]
MRRSRDRTCCRLYVTLSVFMVGCVLVGGASGQSAGATTASLSGTVTDPTGAVIVRATVTATNIATKFTRTALTGEDGTYVIALLPPGTYTVTAAHPGFAAQVVRNVSLTVGQEAVVPFTLSPAATTEVIEVMADVPLVEPTRTQSSTTIDQRQIDGLPINRRNFLDFTLTTAGVTPDRMPAQGAAATSGLSFNGQSARQNNITIDGLDNNDYGSSSVRSTFSQEAIREFQVVNSSYSAEFGRAIGGVINIVTRGGTNDFRGTIFSFLRTRALNARNAFAVTNPPFQQVQFGGTLSGPIRRDRHFFFGSFERLTLSATHQVTINPQIVEAAQALGFPPSVIRRGDLPFSEASSMGLARGDFQLGPNDTLWVRYNLARGYNGSLEPWGGLVAESNGGVGRLRDHTLSAGNTWIISPSIINETRFMFAHRRQTVDPLDPTGGPEVRIFETPEVIVFGRGALLPQPRTEVLWQVVNNFSVTSGRHRLKMGLDWYRGEAPPGTTSIPILFGGQVLFQGLDFSAISGPAFTALQAFAPSRRTRDQIEFLNFLGENLPILFPGFSAPIPDLGHRPIPAAFVQGFGDGSDTLSSVYFSWYAQDDIRLRSTLTLKLGYRFDRQTFPPPFPSSGGNNSNPRLAVAWDPTGRGKILVHGAYGIFYGSVQLGPMFAVRIVNGTKIQTPVLPFPFSLLGFLQPGFRFPEGRVPRDLPSVGELGRIFAADPRFKNGYAHQSTIGVNYLVTPDLAVSLTYQMVRGLHLFLSRNLNPIVNPTCGPIPATCGRVFPGRPEIYQFESSGDSYYHGLTVAVERRMSRKLSFRAHYTFSKAIDDFVDWRVENQETGNPLNLRGERALSLQDARHRAVLSGLWDLDYGKHWLVRGYTFSTIVTLTSGRPYNLLAGVDLNGDGDIPPGDRPASLGRNVGISPGYANVDARLVRTLSLGDRITAQLILESFNLFNRVNISEFGRVFLPGTPLPPKKDGRFIVTPDRYRGAFAARQIQFGIKLLF